MVLLFEGITVHYCRSLLSVAVGIAVIGCNAKQPASTSEVATPVSAMKTVPKPTLRFNAVKDVPGLIDEDALAQEEEMKKRLPGNEFVTTPRAMHEAALGTEFVDAFKAAKECNGIVFYEKKQDVKPDFTLQLGVSGHDKHPDNENWVWILLYPNDPSPKDTKAHGMGGMGTQSNAQLTARDVCLTIWDDIAPNHFKQPGGTVE